MNLWLRKYLFWIALITLSFNVKAQKKSHEGFKTPAHYREFTHTFIEANQQKLLGNLEAAANLYRKCLKLNKKSASANYDLANILVIQNKKEEAFEHAGRAFDLEPENYWYGVLYLELCRDLDKTDDYIETLEKMVKIFPEKKNLKMNLALAYSYFGKTDQALKVYESIEKRVGVTKDVSLSKHKIYVEMGKSKEAEKELLKLIESNPRSKDNLRILAKFYYSEGREIESVEVFEKILSIDPNDAETHFELYDFYQVRANEEKAYYHLKIAFAGEKLDIDSKVKLLFGLYAPSENDEKLRGIVFDLLNTLISTHSENAKAYSVYGDFYFRDRNYVKAQEMFVKAVSLEPNKYLIWRQIIIIDSELKKYDDIFSHAGEALEFFPTQPELYWFQGIAGIQTEKYEDAVKSLKEGIRFVVDNNDMKAQFYGSMGDAYNGMKDYDKSDEAYEKALSYKPNYVYVLNNYSYYLSLRKDKLEKAEQMSKMSLDSEPNNVNYLDTYAWVLFQLGKYEEAKSFLKKAIANGGDQNKTVLEHMGDVCIMLNDADLAIKFWNKAIDKGGDKELILKKITEKTYIESLVEEIE